MKKSIGVFINNRGYEGEEMIFSPFVMMLQIRPEKFCSFIFLSFIAFLKKKKRIDNQPTSDDDRPCFRWLPFPCDGVPFSCVERFMTDPHGWG